MALDWSAWNPAEKAVLLFLFRDKDVLLIHKKRGLGKGKINAPGGRLEPGETYEQAAIRETLEETGMRVWGLKEVTELLFAFQDGFNLYGRVFFAFQFQGVPYETDEAIPFWCPISEIPWDKMWEDDQHWLPRALEGHFVSGKFFFQDDKMLDYHITLRPEGKIEHFFKG